MRTQKALEPAKVTKASPFSASRNNPDRDERTGSSKTVLNLETAVRHRIFPLTETTLTETMAKMHTGRSDSAKVIETPLRPLKRVTTTEIWATRISMGRTTESWETNFHQVTGSGNLRNGAKKEHKEIGNRAASALSVTISYTKAQMSLLGGPVHRKI